MLLVQILISICLITTSSLFGLQKIDPEDQIIVMEEFLSSQESKELIRFYNSSKKNKVVYSDNQISLCSIENKFVQKILKNISDRVLNSIQQNYPLNGKEYHLDHGGIYSRIKGNFCPYHSDNIYFECPIHGKDQSYLRMICNGKCAGSKFVPNHTSWREYTALIYLNDNFEGGEILFEDGPCNKRYQKIFSIKANMLILAPNGPDFYHEVFPIIKGTRYSIHLWYTSDPAHQLILK